MHFVYRNGMLGISELPATYDPEGTGYKTTFWYGHLLHWTHIVISIYMYCYDINICKSFMFFTRLCIIKSLRFFFNHGRDVRKMGIFLSKDYLLVIEKNWASFSNLLITIPRIVFTEPILLLYTNWLFLCAFKLALNAIKWSINMYSTHSLLIFYCS